MSVLENTRRPPPGRRLRSGQALYRQHIASVVRDGLHRVLTTRSQQALTLEIDADVTLNLNVTRCLSVYKPQINLTLVHLLFCIRLYLLPYLLPVFSSYLLKISEQGAEIAALLWISFSSKPISCINTESNKYPFCKKVRVPRVPGGFTKSNIFPYRIGLWTLVVIVLLVAGGK